MRGIVPQKDIRTEAIFASLNDCLYRQMNRFKFTLLVDFDEFVVLLKTKSLLEFTVDELKKADDPTRIGSLVFKNTFFYLQWADDPERMICGRRRFLPKALLLIVVFAIFFFFTTWLHLQFLGEIEESENPGSPSLIMKTAEEKALSPIVPTKGDPRKWMALRDGKIHFFGPNSEPRSDYLFPVYNDVFEAYVFFCTRLITTTERLRKFALSASRRHLVARR